MARLAEKGLSSTAIAQLSFVSRKTVESIRPGRKLGIASCSGLERAGLDAIRSGRDPK